MKLPSLLLIAASLVLMFLALEKPTRAAEKPAALRVQADKAWDEKSYARALELYRQLLPDTKKPESEQIEYRIAVSLGETEQWDAAVDASEKLLQSAQWKARVLYWLGRLYTKVPDRAWKVGERLYYGDDYPKTDKATKPQQVYLSQENAEKTRKYLQDAKIQAQKEHNLITIARFAGPIYPLSNKEEIDLDFDLAATLAAQELDDLIEVLNQRKDGDANFDENVPADVPFDAGWSMPKKVIYLYNEIPRLDDGKDKRDSALALLGKGLWLRSYRQRMDGWAQKYDAELKKTVTRPYPFDHLEAIDYWRELVQKYPNNEVAPQTQILIAQTFRAAERSGESARGVSRRHRKISEIEVGARCARRFAADRKARSVARYDGRSSAGRQSEIDFSQSQYRHAANGGVSDCFREISDAAE